ncbi:MAG: NAD-dependent epimerase/dehydratase family protein [Pseudomonas sp.]|nr:NAD-dependent epimerase/dehydratase family protein [Pseudomonas sp.]
MRILVTGATGFLGKAVVEALALQPEYQVQGATRAAKTASTLSVPLIAVGEFAASTDWSQALQGVDVVIHTAARLNVAVNKGQDPLPEFRRVNTQGTLTLARQAIAAGVKRFIFISTVGVNGGYTTGSPFSELSTAAPDGDYARSKFEAELGLHEISQGTAMDIVVIRPPMIYAANAHKSFPRLLKLIASGMPLPFASIDNRRSMVAVENMVSFIQQCISHPAAANELFLISDGEDISTGEMIRQLAAALGRKANLVPFPDTLMRIGARLVGKENYYLTLCASLEVDSSKSRTLLNWAPPLTVAQAMQKAGADYRRLS